MGPTATKPKKRMKCCVCEAEFGTKVADVKHHYRNKHQKTISTQDAEVLIEEYEHKVWLEAQPVTKRPYYFKEPSSWYAKHPVQMGAPGLGKRR